MKLDLIDGRILVDAAELAPLLDLAPNAFRQRMQTGEIAILSESGEGADKGRFRVTFTGNRWKVRLTCVADGTVLTRVRSRTNP